MSHTPKPKTINNLSTMRAVASDILKAYRSSAEDGEDNIRQFIDTSVMLEIMLDRRRARPVMWECGGSFGTFSACLMVVDDNLRVKYPMFVSRNQNAYNAQQAFIEVHLGHHVLFGYKFVSGEVMTIGMEISEFKYDDATKKDMISCRIWNIALYDSFQMFVDETYLNFQSKNLDSADICTLKYEDRSSIPVILAPKINDYMANAARGIKHWAAVDHRAKCRMIDFGLDTVFDHSALKDIEDDPDGTWTVSYHRHMTDFYEDLRSKSYTERCKSRITPGLQLTNTYDPETKMLAITAIVFREGDFDTKDMILHVARMVVNPEEVVSIWAPNLCPWDASNNQTWFTNILTKIIRDDDDSALVRSRTKYYKFIG